MTKSYLKQPRLINKKYLKDINEHGCCICGQESTSHHITGYNQGGMGTKPCDLMTIPLCERHHSATYDTGIHYNINMWELEHGTQPELITLQLQKSAMNRKITVSMANKYIDKCKKIKDYRS